MGGFLERVAGKLTGQSPIVRPRIVPNADFQPTTLEAAAVPGLEDALTVETVEREAAAPPPTASRPDQAPELPRRGAPVAGEGVVYRTPDAAGPEVNEATVAGLGAVADVPAPPQLRRAETSRPAASRSVPEPPVRPVPTYDDRESAAAEALSSVGRPPVVNAATADHADRSPADASPDQLSIVDVVSTVGMTPPARRATSVRRPPPRSGTYDEVPTPSHTSASSDAPAISSPPARRDSARERPSLTVADESRAFSDAGPERQDGGHRTPTSIRTEQAESVAFPRQAEAGPQRERSEAGPRAASPAQPEPTIRITIGRIEVRAEQQPPRRPVPARRGPALSLADYLRQRSEGMR
jgi:hypothetical protein